MAVYHKEKAEYFDEAIDSIWTKQTHKPEKVMIVVDGKVGDDIEAVIAKWQKQLGDKFIVLRNEENVGLTKSLNKGIDNIDTDLIARMDSDDISEPNRFQIQYDYLMAHPDVDILGGSMQEFTSNAPGVVVRHYPLTHEEAVKSMCKASPLAHPTVMMRTRIFESGLRYNERYRISQDIAFWFDAVAAGYRIANVDDITFRFRRNDEMFMRRSRKKAWGEFCIYAKGLYHQRGLFTPDYIYPIMRLIFRLMPTTLTKIFYNSDLRHKMVK